MATYDNTYSRVVSWLKVILPLAALAGLSTLFMVARTIDPAQDIPFADVDIEELTREERIGRPTFSGMTPGGAAFSLSAERARPDPEDPGKIIGEEIRAGIDMPDGTGIEVTAGGGLVDNASRTAGLRGGVMAQTSDGYLMQAQDVTIDFDARRMWSGNEVSVTSPELKLRAGAFEVQGDGTEDRPYVLVFKDKVNLLYEPEQ
ncbi:hypothetical protein P1J78_10660 [Psychromarinibacter sp. C21-152]|uniref:Lipopolysaccharide export system protein LptC n=1 Tax=Psychromarinibacter sediminicola TaxID=3033385 RepID=A0AAE3T899_9RHOB|nr:hypothetical protein [Psychromarinibacter sediminicola]MDF0601190.1 hypothetical protein [Psychromarinibacter sediminicola]